MDRPFGKSLALRAAASAAPAVAISAPGVTPSFSKAAGPAVTVLADRTRERRMFIIEDSVVNPFRVHRPLAKEELPRYTMSRESLVLVELSREEAEAEVEKERPSLGPDPKRPLRLSHLFSRYPSENPLGKWERGFYGGAESWYLKVDAREAQQRMKTYLVLSEQKDGSK